MKIKSIGVFCGASGSETYLEEAYRIGQLLAERKITVVYGGAKMGMMGALADGALDNQGRVIGVMPVQLIPYEIAHDRATMIYTDDIHKRKARVMGLSDALVALPGGCGTFDELFESITWNQIGLHRKPVGIHNYWGFYADLINQWYYAVSKGFIRPEQRDLLVSDTIFENLLDRLERFEIPPVPTKEELLR